MDQNGATSQTSNSNSNNPQESGHIRLACQACQRKKIKCDRHFPCGQCTRSSLQCVPSTRKPRARHVGKRAVDSELRSRIAKLENLVESLSGEVGGQDGDEGSDGEGEGNGEPDENIAASVGKYMSSPFWSSLTTEVQALRDALEEQPEEDEDPTSPSTSSGPHGNQEYDLIIMPPAAIYPMPGALPEPTPELSATLCNIFCDNVDSLFKVFHTPTIKAFMIQGQNYLGHDHTAPANRAVKTAIWFSAVNTMTDGQCQMLFSQPRGDQLQLFRRLVDVALAQADLMNTTDIATLQAFMTYISAARLTDTSRRTWTLMAVAVRIARAMGLHHESVPRTPYITELRRRLWHQIRFMDVYTSLDRGSEQLITIGSWDTPMAHNTNDSDFDENSTSIPDYDSGFTDMTYSRLAADATYTTQRLILPDTKSGGETWKDRVDFAQKFQDSITEKYLKYCDDSIPLQRFLKAVAGAMSSSMFIRAIRPMARYHSAVPLPRVDSPYVLQIAINSLKASEDLQKDPETQQWRWMVWVGWHALAIALAGLCSIRDTELANEAWVYVEQAYARGSRHVADSRNGMLWRPIEKLYRKASAFRDHTSTPSSVSPPNQNPTAQPGSLRSANTNPFNASPSTTSPSSFDAKNLPITQSMPGSMPTSGLINGPMDLELSTASTNTYNMDNMNPALMNFDSVGMATDMSWMDFERILEDMGGAGADADVGLGPLGNYGWSQGTAGMGMGSSGGLSGSGWDAGLGQGMM